MSNRALRKLYLKDELNLPKKNKAGTECSLQRTFAANKESDLEDSEEDIEEEGETRAPVNAFSVVSCHVLLINSLLWSDASLTVASLVHLCAACSRSRR
jgi:hypothetical protein